VHDPDKLRHVDTSAIYEDGVLKFDPPLAIKNGERIRVTLHVAPGQVDKARLFAPRPASAIDPAVLEKIAMDPELGVDECP
jgi:predicted DNA-binding antitoxin AbrB/MazE fold protein